MTNIKEIQAEYRKNPVTVIAMSEMAGFPNVFTGKLPKSCYLEDLKRMFNVLDVPSTFYNFQSLFFQKATFIQDVLKTNVTVEELNALLKNSVDTTKNRDLTASIGVRDGVKKIYQNPKEENFKIVDLVQSPNLLFIRSSMSQDLMFHCQENQFSVLSKKRCEKAISFLEDDQTIDLLVEDIVNNYKRIYELNPSAQIFEVGVVTPTSYVLPYLKELGKHLKRYIRAVEEVAHENNVAYINGQSIESTSLGKGQDSISAEILNKLKSTPSILETAPEYKAKGDIGHLANLRRERYEAVIDQMLEEPRYFKNDVLNVTTEFNQEMDCFQKTKTALKK